MRTIIASGPKRSGCSLLIRLLDNHPDVMTVIDESYFWEHVYNYLDNLELFRAIFKFPSKNIITALEDRVMLCYLDGVYQQYAPKRFSKPLRFNPDKFLAAVWPVRDAVSVRDIWHKLISAYAFASSKGNYTHSFIGSGDYGKSLIAGQKILHDFKGIFYIRNPYYALDSLKRARNSIPVPNQKPLHCVNFVQNLKHYMFALKALGQLDNRTLVVKFEDLLLVPERIITQIASHVGIEVTDSLLTPTLEGIESIGTSSFKPLNGIDPYPMERKIETLTSQEIILIDEYLKPIMERFNYEKPICSPVDGDA